MGNARAQRWTFEDCVAVFMTVVIFVAMALTALSALVFRASVAGWLWYVYGVGTAIYVGVTRTWLLKAVAVVRARRPD